MKEKIYNKECRGNTLTKVLGITVMALLMLVGIAGAVGGAFWGMLIGLFFWMPWLGLTIGAVAGAITGSLSDYGINDDFIKEVGATIKPGGSALFLLISKWTEDKALERLKNSMQQL